VLRQEGDDQEQRHHDPGTNGNDVIIAGNGDNQIYGKKGSA